MSETILNNGAPVTPYQDPVTLEPASKNELFYTAATQPTEEPIDLYMQLLEEVQIDGYSETVNNAQIQWMNEQDEIKRDYLKNLIEDPSITKDEKQQAIKEYQLSGTPSKSLQDKYFNQITNEEILVNNWDADTKDLIEFEVQLNKTKIEQSYSKLLSTAKQVLNNQSVDVGDPKERVTIAERIQNTERLEDMGDIGGILPLGLDAEFLAYARMIIGETPIWLANMKDLFLYDNPDGPDKKTWGEIMEIVNEQNMSDFSGEWQEGFNDMLLEMGYNQETINGTFVNKALTTVGEWIMGAAEVLHPEDPTKVAVILELATAVAPFGVAKAARIRRRNKAKNIVDKTVAELDTDLKNQKKSIVKPKTPVDPNSPIATTLTGNKERGAKLVDALLQDFTGEIGNNIKFSFQQLIHYLTDPMGKIVKTKDIGFITDVARSKELDLITKRDRELSILNPALADVDLRKSYLEGITNTLNSIVPNVPMVISNTFSVFNPTKTGFNTELAFRKSTTTDYKFREVGQAADQLIDAVGELSEVFIQEVDTRGNIVKEWKRGDKAKVTASQVNGYRVVWKKDSTLYDGYFSGWGETISKKFENSSKIGQLFGRAIFGGSKSSKKTGLLSEWFAAYGSLNKNVEYRYNVSGLMKQAFGKRAQEILTRDVFALNKVERGIFADALEYMDTYKNPETGQIGLEFMTKADLNELAGATLDSKTLNKLQLATRQYRRFDAELYYYDNVTYRNMLSDAGYNKNFYIDSPNGGEPRAMPVKEDFSVKANDPLFFDELGNPQTVTIFDFNTNLPITTYLRPGDKTHFVIDSDGKIGGQVYRLSKQHTDELGNKFNYGTFGTAKPSVVPTNVLPRRPGHVPRVHDEAYVLVEYPKSIKIDGREIDFTNLDTGPTTVLDVDSNLTRIAPDKFTAEMSKNKSLVVKSMQPYGTVRAMHNSRRDAYRYAGTNLRPDSNKIYIVRKSKELDTNQLSDYYNLQERSVQGSKLRNEGIDFQIKSDPFQTIMENAYTVGARSIDQLAIDQFKLEWMTEFGGNNPRITVKKNTPESIAGLPDIGDVDMTIKNEAQIKNGFPITKEQIKMVDGNQEYYDAAIRAWDKLYTKEMGYAPGYLSTMTKSTMDKLGNATEGIRGLGKVNKIIREGQRRPGSVVGIPLKVVTQFRIMFNTVKQLILQPMAAMTPLLVVSAGNPLKFARNVSDTARLVTTYYRDIGVMNKKVRKDMDRIIDSLWEEDGIAQSLPMEKGKLSSKDIDLIIQVAKEQGLLNVSDHQFAKGLFADRIRRLDKEQGIFSKGGTVLQEAGFSTGELINRLGMTIASLRNFEAKNPGVNWRTQKNLNQIMYDAYQLSGGMTDITAYGWQRSTPFRYIGQFASFGHKMGEGTWNAQATPFNMTQRIQLAAWNIAMWGTAPYAMYSAVEWMASLFGASEEAKQFGQELEKLPVSYKIWNYVGDYVMGTERDSEGKVIKSEALPGEVFGPYGMEPFGVYSVVYKNLVNLFQDDLKTRDLGATLNYWKGLGPAFNFIATIYTNPYNFTVAERAELTVEKTAELLPVVKGIWRTVLQLSHESAGLSKTGQEVFGGQTAWETVSQNILSIPNRSQRGVYDQFTSRKEKTDIVRDLSKEYVSYIFKLKGETLTLQDVKEYIVTAKVHLDNADFTLGSAEYEMFTDEVMRLVGRQNKSMAKLLAQDFKRSYHYNQEIYSEAEILRIDELADILKREDPLMSTWLDEQVGHMKEANQLAKEK